MAIYASTNLGSANQGLTPRAEPGTVMRPEEFEARFQDCREMPGSNDPAYRSAMNEMIMAAGGSIQLDRNTDTEISRGLTAAIADDRRRAWRGIGSSPMDARLAAFSDLYADANPDQRRILRSFFDGEQLRELEQFVARTARLVETTGDPRWLRRGIVAACIDGGRYDFRDLIASLGILRYGAEREGIEIGPFFRQALEMSDPAEAPELRELFLTVEAYPKGTLRDFVREFGPPEWRDET